MPVLVRIQSHNKVDEPADSYDESQARRAETAVFRDQSALPALNRLHSDVYFLARSRDLAIGFFRSTRKTLAPDGQRVGTRRPAQW